MLRGNKALHALDRARQLATIAEDLAVMNTDTSDLLDVAALKDIIGELQDAASTLRGLVADHGTTVTPHPEEPETSPARFAHATPAKAGCACTASSSTPPRRPKTSPA